MRRLATDRRAIAAVEFALVSAGLLFPLVAITGEIGQAVLTQYMLSRGLHAGLVYAWALPTNATTTTIQNAATAGFENAGTGTYRGITPSPTAAFQYYCIDPTTGIHGNTQVTSTTTCGSGQVLGTWVQLTITATIPTMFPAYKGTATWPLTVTGTVRIS